jgi:16S rRNA (cytosine1402-N4)-methyltransferase
MIFLMNYYNPVLLPESVHGLDIKPNGVYVDVTFGGGGHSREILKRLGTQGKLFAFDTDKDAFDNALEDERFTLIPENFRFIKRFLRLYDITKVDGILADLGVSSHQFDAAERGFSTRFEGKLDMRMNVNSSLSGFEVINNYNETQLAKVFSEYGELNQAKAMARKIITERISKPIETTADLKNVLHSFTPRGRENKVLAQVFQAIRIEVNQEIEVLKEFLLQIPELLNVKGRLSVISYHSLEDRLVKRFIKNGLFEGEPTRDLYGNFQVPLQKVGNLLVPTNEEIKINNRARSAKLRVAEKI